jgi:hypothetical protein
LKSIGENQAHVKRARWVGRTGGLPGPTQPLPLAPSQPIGTERLLRHILPSSLRLTQSDRAWLTALCRYFVMPSKRDRTKQIRKRLFCPGLLNVAYSVFNYTIVQLIHNFLCSIIRVMTFSGQTDFRKISNVGSRKASPFSSWCQVDIATGTTQAAADFSGSRCAWARNRSVADMVWHGRSCVSLATVGTSRRSKRSRVARVQHV